MTFMLVVRTLRVRGSLWIVAAVLSVACTLQERSEADGYVVRDSAGITITEVTAPPEALPIWELGNPPHLAIKGDGGRGPPLTDVSAASWMPGGEILIVDPALDHGVLVYDSLGRFTQSFSRYGEGPGEFRNIGTVSATSDGSIVLFDRASDRLSVFHPDSGLIRSISLRSDDPQVRPLNVWALSDTFFLQLSLKQDLSWFSGYDGRPRPVHSTAILTITDRDGRTVGNAREFRGPSSIQFEWGDASLPLSGRPAVAVSSGRIAFTTGRDFELEVTGLGLEPIASWRWLRSEPISSQDLQAVRASIESTFGESRPDVARDLLATVAPDVLPPHRPPLGRLIGDGEGGFWVSSFDPYEEPSEWYLFEAGRPIRRLVLDESVRILAASRDLMMVARRDSLDVPSVFIHPLLSSVDRR